MAEPLSRIHDSLDAFAGRARRLLVARALLQLAAAVVSGLVLLAGLYSSGVARDIGLLISALVCAAACVGAVSWPLLTRWRAAGLRATQAQRVEAARPVLRGALVTAVDRGALLAMGEGAKPAPGGVSRVLLARAAGRAADTLETVAGPEVAPAGPAWRTGGGFGVVVLVALLAGWLLPVGPFDALGVAAGGSAAGVRLDASDSVVAEEVAVVGDITLRYIFPDYTGIQPVEVPNSDGTIHAPPGSRVEIAARTHDTYDAAAIQVDAAPAIDTPLEGGRNLSGAIEVTGAGTWRFVLFRGNEIVYSPSYVIDVEDDAPPVVALEGTLPSTVAIDRPLGIAWSVQDDYGIKKVVLEVTRADGTVQERVLREPLDASARLQGGVRLSPKRLGIPAGETVTLRVVAYDNDLMGGSKQGASPEVTVKVLGSRGKGRRLQVLVEQIRDLMLDALADHLVEAVPPARSDVGMTNWVSVARERLTPLQELASREWGEVGGSGPHADLVQEVLADGARLYRFTLTTWEPGSGRRITEGDLSAFAKMHGEQIESLERAVYVLDLMLQQAAMGDLAQQLASLAADASALAADAGDLEASELLARLDRLDRMLQQMAAQAKRLDDGSLKEFVNSRTSEAINMVEEIRKAIAEGRLDEARKMLEDLAETLQQSAENINDNLAKRQQGEDELGQEFDAAMSALAELEKQQTELAEEMAKQREEHGGAVDEVVAMWGELDVLAERARDGSRAAVGGAGDGRGWRVDSIRWLEKLDQGTAGIQDEIRARDATRALNEIERVRRSLNMSQRLLQIELDRPRPEEQPIPAGGAVAAQSVGDVALTLDRMIELLEDLEQRNAKEPPAVQQAAREMASRQGELREAQKKVQGDVERVERAMPTADGQAAEAMKGAGEAMQRAQRALKKGRGMAGEGHQADAARQLQETQNRLRRAMQDFKQMQRSAQQMQGEGQPKGPGGGDGEGGEDDGEQESESGQAQFELPLPETFQTPEEYRRALLEGMESDVPDEYDDFKRRYYEELIRQ
jgi:hypothetical protein